MSPRSMFSADVQQASDRALVLLAREHAHGEALTEDEVAELVTLLSSPAGLLVGPASFDKDTKLIF